MYRVHHLPLALALGLALTGCWDGYRVTQERLQETRKEATTAASSASVEQRESKPVSVTVSPSGNAAFAGNLQVMVYLPPQDVYQAGEVRQAKETSAASLSASFTERVWSPWGVLIIAVAALLMVFTWKWLTNRLSLAGGLRAITSARAEVHQAMISAAPDSPEMVALRSVAERLESKHARLTGWLGR